jgi:hypothetical protein
MPAPTLTIKQAWDVINEIETNRAAIAARVKTQIARMRKHHDAA